MARDYYQVLGVRRDASDEDIRRAYRRLAVAFHPDKNHSPEALTVFQEINEAHEILSDPYKRSRYDWLLAGGEVIEEPVSQKQWHRDPAYRRKYTPGYQPPPRKPSERLLLMLHFLKYMRVISFSGLGWCLLLTIDYILPPRISIENVLDDSQRKMTWEFDHTPHVVVTDKGHQFPIAYDGVPYFPEGSQAEVVTSSLLNVLIRVESKYKPYTIDSLATVYQNFLLAPVTLFIVSLAGLILRKGIEFRFNIEVAICILLFFNLIFLLFSIP